VRTVESHRMHLTQKLRVHNRAELVAFAREAGLLDGE
jgi:DNA-binding CsgD family transcriptional regulator